MAERGSGAARGLRTIGPEPEGATPLDPDDLDGLIPSFVANRTDLNLVEYENIAKALPWAFQHAGLLEPLQVLDYLLLFELHRRMFEDVWTWAGKQRLRETNLGVAPHQIPTQVKQALDDARFWHENDVYSVDERAARLHHRLVTVHPFQNGNGRCTRLFADLYLASVGAAPFEWGAGPLDRHGETRAAYVSALVRADDGDFASLLAFARSSE